MDLDQLWWTRISNAALLVNTITENLLEEKSLVVSLSKCVPWYDTFRRLIEDDIAKQRHDRRWKFKHESELQGLEPGKYLFEHYCGEDLKRQYRPALGYARFLAENPGNTLKQTYLWLRFDSRDRAEAWLNFIGEYKNFLGDSTGGVFLLEVPDELPTNGYNIEVLSYDKLIGHYDRFIFNLMAANDVKGLSPMMKQYFAELVSNVIGNDIELSAECMRCGEKFLNNPRKALVSIVSQRRRGNGDQYKFDCNDDHIEQCAWTAQIKLTFPLMENFRRKFIEQYYQEINRCLPSSTGYGELIEEPKETDIGFLYHNAYQWGLPSEEWERLKMYRDARNALAHMKTLKLEELQKIFQTV